MAIVSSSSTFIFDEVHVRTARDDDGSVLFAAKDICRALAIKNHIQKLKSIDQAYITHRPYASAGGRQVMCFVSEFGLYALTFASRKPEARRFQKWIYEEVIPSLRTRGSYTMANTEALKDRDTKLVQLACTHFQDDATLMCLANEKLKTLLGSGTSIATADVPLPISVALELKGHNATVVQRHRCAVGRLAAKLYREQYGRPPNRTQQNVGGRLCAVNAYSRAELHRILPACEQYLGSVTRALDQ